MLEIDSLERLRAVLTDGSTRLVGLRVQGVDLTTLGPRLLECTGEGAVFLGCPAPAAVTHHLVQTGAIVFPVVPDLPFDPYLTSLHTPDELYRGIGRGYAATPDGATYEWYLRALAGRDVYATLMMAVHDHSVDDALDDYVTDDVADRSLLVGVMGGHALRRSEPGYRAAAELGRTLTQAGRMVVTGGGPGAMEAANLGAWVAPHPDEALDEALDVLGRCPDFAPDIRGWAAAAFHVRSAWPDGAPSLGIPTWHYGHEPPNAFATHVAKYFRNAMREDVLLALADGGVIFLPGAAGTVEEIFADATGNYYGNTPAPMVLVDRAYWTDQLPAWPLLSALAGGRDMDGSVHVVDTTAEAAAMIIGEDESSVHPPF